MIDPVTNLLEAARYEYDFSSAEAFRLFQNHWLAKYPRPVRCIHDAGPEFIGHDFQFPLQYAGIEYQPVSPANPQSNSIIETVHRAMGNVLRLAVQVNPPATKQEALKLVDSALATAVHSIRSTSNSALDYWPTSH